METGHAAPALERQGHELASVPSLDPAQRTTDQLYRFLVESVTDYAIFAVSPSGIVVSWNPGAEHAFGYRRDQIVGSNFEVIFTAEDRAAGVPKGELRTAEVAGRTDIECWHVRSDGSRFRCANTVQPLRDAGGSITGFTKIVRDITERYLATEALRASEERLRLMLESVHDYALYSLSPRGTVTLWNMGAERLYGYSEKEMLGQNHARLFTLEDTEAGIPALELRRAAVLGNFADERWNVRKDGTRFFASGKVTQIDAAPLGDVARGFVKVSHDITERRRLESELRHEAFHDALTGLPNRGLLLEHLTRLLARTRRHKPESFGLLFFDVDNFKLVNDTFGHILADRLLIEIARRISATIRPEDILARLGGDEFGILIGDLEETGEAILVAERIQAALAVPFQIEEHEVTATASLGIAIGSAAYARPEHVLRDADIAMYEAKAAGRARYAVFDASMRERVVALQTIEAELNRALDRHEFRVAYQPIVVLETSNVVGFEALVRWQHPTRGFLPAAEFVPAAEAAGLITAIDRWVLQRACEQVRSRSASSGIAPILSVNLSSRDFLDADLVAHVQGILHATGIRATDLKFEITESALMDRSTLVTTLLANLRALGIEFYIDDFGTGYSSLSYLRHLPVSMLKIDRSFVETMTSDPGGAEVVRAIVSLAHTLELKVVAEGIETHAELDALRALGCDFGQGFYFSKGLDWNEAGEMLGRTLP